MKPAGCVSVLMTTLAVLWCSALSLAAAERHWQPNFGRLGPNTPIHWGRETNHIKAGLLVQYSPSEGTNQTLVGLFPVLYSNSATNGNMTFSGWVHLWLPPFNSRYQMTLLDNRGNPVQRTAKGRALGKPFEAKFHGATVYDGYEGRILMPYEEDYLPVVLILQDYFTVTNRGKHHLAFELRGVRKVSGRIERYDLPVSVDLEIKNP